MNNIPNSLRRILSSMEELEVYIGYVTVNGYSRIYKGILEPIRNTYVDNIKIRCTRIYYGKHYIDMHTTKDVYLKLDNLQCIRIQTGKELISIYEKDNKEE